MPWGIHSLKYYWWYVLPNDKTLSNLIYKKLGAPILAFPPLLEDMKQIAAMNDYLFS
tara:strand:+ start:112 stop:282 length:171 start_codon:yes stop_codon:yes gene_type:complete